MYLEKNTLNKHERLKSRKLIASLFDNGKIINHYPFRVLYNFSNDSDFEYPSKIAVSVSKKNFKKAVSRNTIKRKIREVYRTNKHEFYKMLIKNDQKIYFIVIYTAKEILDYQQIEKEMQLLLSKLVNRLSPI